MMFSAYSGQKEENRRAETIACRAIVGDMRGLGTLPTQCDGCPSLQAGTGTRCAPVGTGTYRLASYQAHKQERKPCSCGTKLLDGPAKGHGNTCCDKRAPRTRYERRNVHGCWYER
jgi:hypothetical protein